MPVLKYTDYRREEKVADRFLYLLPLQGLKGRILVRLCTLSNSIVFHNSLLFLVSTASPECFPSLDPSICPHHGFHVLKALP